MSDQAALKRPAACGAPPAKRPKPPGSQLDKAMQAMLSKLSSGEMTKLKETLAALPDRKLSVVSLCSGSEIQHVVGDRLLSTVDGSTTYVTCTACDNAPNKRAWIQNFVFKDAAEMPRTFSDIVDMAKASAKCAVHKSGDGDAKMCKTVPDHLNNFIVACACSCKELSKLNSSKPKKSGILKQGGSGGSSAATFEALIEFLATHPVKMWLGENVDEMRRGSSDNYQCMVDKLASVGFACETMKLDALNYGAATTRTRAFILGLSCQRSGLAPHEAQAVLRSMKQLVEKLQIGPFALKDFLLMPGHEYLKIQLEHLQSKDSQSSSSNDSKQDWREKLADACQKVGMVVSQCRPSPEIASSPWFHSMCERERMALAYETIMRPEACSVDVSQTIAWCGRGKDGVLPTITPRGKIYMLPRGGDEKGREQQFNRILSGLESLSVQGWPIDSLEIHKLKDAGISDALMKDLAGNSVHALCFCAVLIAVMTFWPRSDPEVSEEVSTTPEETINEDEVTNILGL
ncbi:unnamed protein product [Prorocentrum cordatum]|uniref:DNA (cytosine-5-)-methyltransferase n=1 Tax=Prorocentrum cordatum TaxID=2364126 RepID=A0ABN9SBJ8_9DINO|nr:unnamed protein product [Polarella glacialis]